MTREDLQRVHESLLVTMREVQGLVSSAQRSLSVEDYGAALDVAFEKTSLCVGCMEGLTKEEIV